MTDRRFRTSEQGIRRWNRVFKALAAEPRRQLVGALMDAPAGESVRLPEAAMNPATRADPDSIRLELQHRHLPMLESAGYVEWYRTPLRATRAPRFEELVAVLETLRANAAALPAQLVSGDRLFDPDFDPSDGL